MPYPPINAGMRITASLLTDMQPQEVEQVASAQVNNSTTFVDTNIVIPTIAGAKYSYRLLVGYATNATADIKFQWSTAGGGEVRRFSAGPGVSGTGSTDSFSEVSFRRPLTDSDVAVGGNASALTYSYWEQGVIIGDGFNAIFQFAQNTADASNTSITGSTRCDYQRIG